MLIVAWIFVASLLALWSLLWWGVHALLTLDVTDASALQALLDRVPYAEWIDRWIPGWKAAAHLAIDLAARGVAWLGDLLPVVVWTAWGVGAVLLLLLGGVLTLVVRLVRASARPAAPAAA